MNSPVHIIRLALLFGIVCGLVEGIGLMAGTRIGTDPARVWIEIVSISTVVDTILFAVTGFLLAGAQLLIRRISLVPIAFFVFLAMCFWSWLGVAHVTTRNGILALSLGLGVAGANWCAHNRALVFRLERRLLPFVVLLGVTTVAVINGGGWLRERLALATLPTAAPGAPNVLVIVVDTLRADHLSAYGYKRLTSPEIDRIAQEGVLFENAYSTAPWTAPSHASLLTGTFQFENKVFWSKETRPFMDDRFLTLPEAVRKLGYRTAAFSGNLIWFTRAHGFGRGFMRFDDFFYTPTVSVSYTRFGKLITSNRLFRSAFGISELGRKWAPDVNRPLIRWMKEYRDRPFFAFINYFDVHDPYSPPEPYVGKFSDLKRPGGRIDSDQYDGYNPNLTPDLIKEEVDAYDGAIAYLDDQIGRLFNELRELHLDKDLLVILTSDHGEAFGEHGVTQHGNSVYREEIHIPLVFWRPGRIPSGQRIELPVSNAALPSTVMDLLGTVDESPFPGRSLRELWERPGVDVSWTPPLSEMELRKWKPEKVPARHGALSSIVGERYHYIKQETAGEELYDWKKDPFEQKNLIDSADPSDVDRLRNSLLSQTR